MPRAPLANRFGGQLIERKIEFQHRRPRILGVGVKLDHLAKLLQGLECQPLVPTDLVNLVIITQRQQVLGIGGIVIRRVEINIALRRSTRFGIQLALVIGKCLHDQGALCQLRIGIKPFNLRKEKRGVLTLATAQLVFAPLIDLLGSKPFQRNIAALGPFRCGC